MLLYIHDYLLGLHSVQFSVLVVILFNFVRVKRESE